jgi:HK97 family phage portal protein
MSILDPIRRLFAARNDIGSAEIRRGDGVWESFTGSASAEAPSEAAALAVTAVYACTTLISGAISSLPMHVYRRSQDGDLSRNYNSDLWWMLNEEFCPRWSAAAGWSFMTQSKLLHGDAFAEILRDRNGGIRGLLPIHPVRVRVICEGEGSQLIYEVQPDSTITLPSNSSVRVIGQDDMLHVPGFGFNGLRGLSALKNSLRGAGRLAITAQDFSSNFLKNSARPDYALKATGNLDQVQFDRLQEFLAQHQGPVNSGKPMLLEGGLEIQALTMPLEEMQLLETRKFQVEEVARAFGVQPFMIGHTEKTSSWGTGVEAMGSGFVRYTLRDHLNAFQNEINRKFFRTTRNAAEFDTTELERGDTAAMFSAVRIALGRAGEPAFMSVEEARTLLRMPRKITGTLPKHAEAAPKPAEPAPEPIEPDKDDVAEGGAE